MCVMHHRCVKDARILRAKLLETIKYILVIFKTFYGEKGWRVVDCLFLFFFVRGGGPLVGRRGVSRLCAISAAAGFLMRSLFVKSTQGGLSECLAFAL